MKCQTRTGQALSVHRVAPASRRCDFRIFGSVLGAVLVGISAVPLFAQAPNLAMIRKTSPVSALDQTNIQNWVDGQVDQLFASQTFETDEPKIKTQLLENAQAADATPAFKEALAKSVADSLTKRYAGKTSPDDPSLPKPLRVISVLMVLNEYKDPAALNAFKTALSDSSSSGVRYAGAKGLLDLRAKFTPQQWTGLLADIKKAAIAEPNPWALAEIYRLLSVDPKADAPAQEVTPAFLEVLGTRLKRYEDQHELPNLGEGEAATWLKTRIQAVPNAPRNNDIILILARLLADAVNAYADPSNAAPQKELLEKLILTAEQQLKDVVKGSRALPDVSKIVAAGGTTAAKNAVDELDKWVGSTAAEGILNQAPYNFPRALGIKRAAPATASAPATQP